MPPHWPPMEVTLTMRPHLRVTMAGRLSWARMKAPRRFTASMRSQSAPVTRANLPDVFEGPAMSEGRLVGHGVQGLSAQQHGQQIFLGIDLAMDQNRARPVDGFRNFLMQSRYRIDGHRGDAIGGGDGG